MSQQAKHWNTSQPAQQLLMQPSPLFPHTWPVVQLHTRTVPSWLPVNSWPVASSMSTLVTFRVCPLSSATNSRSFGAGSRCAAACLSEGPSRPPAAPPRARPPPAQWRQHSQQLSLHRTDDAQESGQPTTQAARRTSATPVTPAAGTAALRKVLRVAAAPSSTSATAVVVPPVAVAAVRGSAAAAAAVVVASSASAAAAAAAPIPAIIALVAAPAASASPASSPIAVPRLHRRHGRRLAPSWSSR